jgi:uncharacterized membrane protein YdcZ (DUF606 family)
MIACIAILSILLIWKNKWLAYSIAIVLGLVSLYFLLACYKEYMEFPAGDSESTRLILTGGLIFGSLIVISSLMLIKYFLIIPAWVEKKVS